MRSIPRSVSFDFGREEEDGGPHGMGLSEDGLTPQRPVLYGQLDVILRTGADDFRPAIWDVSPPGRLLHVGSEHRHRAPAGLLDVPGRRQSDSSSTLVVRPGRPRSFSIDLLDFIREFFSTAEAIDGKEDPRPARFRTWLREQQAAVRKSLPHQDGRIEGQ